MEPPERNNPCPSRRTLMVPLFKIIKVADWELEALFAVGT